MYNMMWIGCVGGFFLGGGGGKVLLFFTQPLFFERRIRIMESFRQEREDNAISMTKFIPLSRSCLFPPFFFFCCCCFYCFSLMSF